MLTVWSSCGTVWNCSCGTVWSSVIKYNVQNVDYSWIGVSLDINFYCLKFSKDKITLTEILCRTNTDSINPRCINSQMKSICIHHTYMLPNALLYHGRCLVRISKISWRQFWRVKSNLRKWKASILIVRIGFLTVGRGLKLLGRNTLKTQYCQENTV